MRFPRYPGLDSSHPTPNALFGLDQRSGRKLCHPPKFPSTVLPPLTARQPFRGRDIAARAQDEGENEGKPPSTLKTCRRCRQRFNPAENHDQACSYHPCNWSGGEKAKALGFLRESADPADSLSARLGGTGTLRFWDCCGADSYEAQGCRKGRHISWDDEDGETFLVGR